MIQEQESDVKHKILFFFMPHSVVFLLPLKDDDANSKILKSITPYFYWCSAHEFDSKFAENKFLFQYQVYFIENKQIIPGEVIQEWFSNKNNIKISIMNFIDKWDEHKRILIDPNAQNEKELIDPSVYIPSKNKENYYSFSSFAKFVAESIIQLKNIYIEKSEEINFDFLQKKFWQNMAEYYQNIILNINNEKNTPKKRKTLNKKSTKKTKNETIQNKRPKQNLHRRRTSKR